MHVVKVNHYLVLQKKKLKVADETKQVVDEVECKIARSFNRGNLWRSFIGRLYKFIIFVVPYCFKRKKIYAARVLYKIAKWEALWRIKREIMLYYISTNSFDVTIYNKKVSLQSNLSLCETTHIKNSPITTNYSTVRLNVRQARIRVMYREWQTRSSLRARNVRELFHLNQVEISS